jgi:mannosylglycerate hydrolase
MGELLGILERDPEYRAFLMDGQASPIEDYLEVMPDRRSEIERRVREGRLMIGPWLTLPDLYPVAGESLVRNLLKGVRYSEKLGGCLRMGYTSFGWGQTAQLPQIYAGFGFDFIICAKKVSEERAPQSEFLWRSPDGATVLASRLGEFARANFFFNAYINARFGLRFLSDEFAYSPEKAGSAYHWADASERFEDHFILETKQGHDWSYLPEGVEKAWRATDDTALPERRLFLSGCDFSTAQPDLTELIRQANKLNPEREFLSAPLSQYRDDLMAMLDMSKLRVIEGELRDGPSCDCSGNALASRAYLKQLNKQAEHWMFRKAEPLSTVMASYGAPYPAAFLDVGIMSLLRSHPHDSINGVAQDKTADDTENRLRQALEIGQVLHQEAVRRLLARIDMSSLPEDREKIVAINSAFSPVREVVEVCVDLPQDKCVWMLELVDETGASVPIQHISRQEMSLPVHDLAGRPWPAYVDRHILLFEADVPAFGFRTYAVRPLSTFNRKHHYWLEMRKTKGGEICQKDGVLENEHLVVSLNPNGTFDLLSKETGRLHPGLLYFEDTGDVGNYWAYYPPYENQTHLTLSSAPRAWLSKNGPLSATLCVEHTLRVPAAGEEPLRGVQGESRRSAQTVDLVITSEITLSKGAKKVDVTIRLRNTAQSHRLRAAFPAGIKTDRARAGGHFTVDDRPAVPARDKEGMYWNEMQTLPMQRFVDISDDKSGFAVITDSSPEYELKGETLCLTLFRAMGNMIVTGWECVGVFPNQKGSQTLRDLEFKMSLLPHAGNRLDEVVALSEKSNAICSYQVSGHTSGDFAPSLSLCSISDPNVVLSCLKKAEDRETFIMRLYNSSSEDRRCSVNFANPPKAIWAADLNEGRIDSPGWSQSLDKGAISLSVPPWRIATIEMEFQQP